MAIDLITGIMGSAKTLFCVSKIFEFQKKYPDRQIFTNITNLMIDGVEPMPDDWDWRKTPPNSLVIYDEFQQLSIFYSKPAEATIKITDRGILQELALMRKTGHDVWLITQSASNLAKYVRGLVTNHYHLIRKLGFDVSRVYQFPGYQDNPVTYKKKAISEFDFSHDKKLFKYFHSADFHHKERIIPKKAINMMILALFLICILGWLIKTKGASALEFVKGDKKGTVQAKNTSNNQNSSIPQTINNQFASSTQVNQPAQNQNLIEYNITNPFDVKIANNQRTAVSMPVFSGCVEMGKKISCYTEQGTLLKVDFKIAKRVTGGEIPYNYFRNNQNVSNNGNVTELHNASSNNIPASSTIATNDNNKRFIYNP